MPQATRAVVLVVSTLLLAVACGGTARSKGGGLCERLTSSDEAVRIQAAEEVAGLRTLDRETVRGLARLMRIDGDGAKAAAITAAQHHRAALIPLLVDVHDQGSYEEVMGAIGLLSVLEPKAREAVPDLLATAATGYAPACPNLDEPQRYDLENLAFTFVSSAAPRSASDLDALWPSLRDDRTEVRALLVDFPIRMALEAGIRTPTTPDHILDLVENEPSSLGIVDKGLSFLPLLTLDDAQRRRAFSVLDEALNGERGDATTAARVLWEMRGHPGASALLSAAFAHPDDTARSLAWAHLEELEDPGRIQEALVALLDADDPDLRGQACARVSDMPPSESFDALWPRVVALLQAGLSSQDAEERLGAAILLARHQTATPEVLGVLERALDGKNQDLAIQAVVFGLPPLTDVAPGARRLMLKALTDPRESVRAYTLIALAEADAKAGHAYALPTLKKLMETEEVLDGLAALLYVEAGGEPHDALPKLLEEVVRWSATPDYRPRMADAIVLIGDEAKPHLPGLREAADRLKTMGADDGILRSLIARLEAAD